MVEKNKLNAWLVGLVIATLICSFGFNMTINSKVNELESGLSEEQVQSIIANEISKLSVPSAEEIASLVIIPAVEIPEIESADNVLLNEFLENEFEVEYTEIKDNAEIFALEELEDDDYEVVIDYLKSLLAEGEELDEGSVVVYLEDTEIEVTKLGLGDEEDKCARVTFEIEVEYELEEGVRDDFEKDLVVVYDVCFEEGNFLDEEVNFVSIE